MSPEAAPQGQAVPRRRALNRAQRRTMTFYIFVAPWLIGFLALSVFPLVVGLLTSLTNYDGLNLPSIKFVGVNNYLRAFADPDVPFSMGRTVLWGILNVPLWLTISFGLALILNQEIRGRGGFRTIYYLPTLIPAVAAITAWRIILEQNFGVLNHVISQFRPGTAIPWMTGYSLFGMTMISVWGGLGFGMVIFLAALQGIPSELLEAARIDGANSWQSFWGVTFPLMTPVIFFQLVLALIGAFQQLNLPLILTQVGVGTAMVPPRPIYLYMIHTYRQIFVSGRYGYGTALLWMLFILIILLTAFVFWTQRFWVYGSEEGDKG